MNWIERYPERLTYELEDFRRRGLEFQLDETVLREERRVELHGSITAPGEPAPVRLIIRYPDAFPFFRPDVFAPDLSLGRHQNPFEKNLCLLDRSTRAWDPDETAAHLVAIQVPYLLGLLRKGPDAMRDGEVAQGEPLSYFLQTLSGTFVLIPDELLALPASARSGTARLAFSDVEPPKLRVRGLLASASVRGRGSRSNRVADAPARLLSRFNGRSIEIAWTRVDPPATRDLVELVAQARAAGAPAPKWHSVADGEIAVVAIVFSEEVEQGASGDQWYFIVQMKQRIDKRLQPPAMYPIRGERYGLSDLQARVPALAGLSGRRVALVGLGALGGPLAVELARPGLGELRVLDFDLVEAGTTVRWPFGLSAVASPKGDYLVQVVGRESPWTKITQVHRMLGETSDRARESDFDALRDIFDSADLVIDASAELGVQYLVSNVADELRRPQLYLWATEGARGGVVARVFPGETGCWYCLQLAFARGHIPLPPLDATGSVQPRGCGTRTFTGASFDLAPVWVQAARVAASILTSGLRVGQSDVHVLTNPPAPAPPEWTSFPLAREEGCPCCGDGAVTATAA